MAEEQTKSQALLRGNVVIVALAIFTAIEFVIAVTWSGNGSAALLGVVALVKAALIIEYFMHFQQIWKHIVKVWYEILDVDPEAAE